MLALWFAVGLMSLVAVVVVVAGATTILLPLLRRAPSPTGPTRPSDDDPAEPCAPVWCAPPRRWTPHDYPMGPVSGWPHLVDRPETVPTASPHRTDITDLY